LALETLPVVPDKNQLALDRTFMALERTLMAWIRTATSLITFGFTLYKFFYYLQQQDPVRHPEHVFGARTVGILMIVIGLLSLGLAAAQHWQQLKRLRTHYAAPRSLSQWVAVLVAALGLVALLTTAFQH
jgi:putative membrane protein